MANITRTQLDTLSLANFPNNNSQLISPQDLRDWLESGVDSFVTQKDKSTFENAFYEAKGSPVTAASTTSLSNATGNFLHIVGTNGTQIDSFGTCSAGARFVLYFEISVILNHNATSLIIPGGNDITTTAGDAVMLISEGSGNWRVIGYFPGTGLPVGTVTSVTASSPLASSGGNAPNITLNTVSPNPAGSFTSADITVDAYGRVTAASSGTGGSPGGADTEVQYNNLGSFGGIPELTYSGGFVQIESPKIGVGGGNGHFHMHNATSTPSGIANYITQFAKTSPKELGLIFGTDAYESYIQFGATADRTYTLPDATGNFLIDTVIPSLNNATSAGEIRFKEDTANGSNYVAIKSPSALSADVSFTLPNADGSNGQVIQTNGSGVLSWVANGGRPYLTNITSNTVTGLTEQLLVSLLIPANTYGADSHIQFNGRFTRPASSGQTTIKFYLNTSAVIGGTNFGSFQLGSGSNTSFRMMRSMSIINATTTTNYNAVGNTVGSDFGAGTDTNAAINWTIDQYFVVSAQSNSATGSNTSRAIIISQM